MKTSKFHTHIAGFLVITATFLGGCGGGSSGIPSANIEVPDLGTETLFSDATVEAASIASELPQDDVDHILTRRQRYVRVQFPVLKRLVQTISVGQTVDVTGRLRLNVFDDEDIVMKIESVERVAEENFIVVGRIEGDEESAVTLVVNEGVLVANVRKGEGEESYEVRHAAGGVHTVAIRRDEEEKDCPSVNAATVPAEPGDDTPLGGNADGTLATREIDILGAYTPNARIKMGGKAGIKALIQLGTADTNAALRDSGSSLRVRLVGVMEVKRNESGNWSNDLSYLRQKTDGRWDEVHAERARLGADQVTLVATYPNSTSTAGIGYINSSASTAFTIVKTSAFRTYTFSHELGHNLGLNHSDGYVNSAGRFRTIIAYGSYPRIRRYSNPNVSYKGYRTGSTSKNEVRIIGNNSLRVSSLLAKRVTTPLATPLNETADAMGEGASTPVAADMNFDESVEMAADE